MFVIPILVLGMLMPDAMTPSDPAYAPLAEAYGSLSEKNYERAIELFQRAAALAPHRAAIRKDLGYTYLKIGEVELARDSFAQAVALDSEDEHVALEYAFLCYETKQQAAARRIFDRIRKNGNPVAEQAFRNIDSELAAGIERWSRALEMSPNHFSAHQELARLAEQRDMLDTAAEHYEHAWRLRPDLPELLVDLGRVWQRQKKDEKAHAALLAASRGAQPRAAEAARELLPDRYPYVYEFTAALGLDPGNTSLRRELAYLHLAMGNKSEAEREFAVIVEKEPADLLSAAQLGFLLLGRREYEAAKPLLDRVLESGDEELGDRVREALKLPRLFKRTADQSRRQTTLAAKELAERSLQAGYLQDALRYLRVAHENDPVDFNVMLKLGWVHNILKNDKSALEWFRLAKSSNDATTAREAAKAYGNLRPSFQRFTHSAWMFPMYSSRWRDLFAYAQFKSEYKLPGTRVRVYASVRFTGDIRGAVETPISSSPLYLSETAAILGGGISGPIGKWVTAWAEAGRAFSYLKREDGRSRPDYRGGLSFSRTFGKSILSETNGVFSHLNADAVYISRFEQDTLVYSQNRWGYTTGLGALRTQVYWNTNLTTDSKRLPWANTLEHGPGVRFRLTFLPKSVYVGVDSLSGRYLIREGNPHGLHFQDLRIGLWYALSR